MKADFSWKKTVGEYLLAYTGTNQQDVSRNRE
jgi:hypothetical protein